MNKIRDLQSLILQSAVFAVVVVLLVSTSFEVRHNLEAQGLTSGFGFLFRSTGWDVAFSPLPYTINDTYSRVLLIGLLNTILLGLGCLLSGSVVGLVIGAARNSGHPLLQIIGTLYVESTRNIPLILQIVFFYIFLIHEPGIARAVPLAGFLYVTSRGLIMPALNLGAVEGALFIGGLLVCSACGAGMLLTSGRSRTTVKVACWIGGAVSFIALTIGLAVSDGATISIPQRHGLNFVGGLTIPPELLAMIMGITIYGGAFISEIVRGGLNAVPKGTLEAAKVLGLSPLQRFFRVHLPQAVPIMIPMLSNQYIWLMKATTLGIAVGFTDFFNVVSTSIDQSGHTIELIGILMLGFLTINGLLSIGMNVINRRVNGGGVRGR